MDNIIIKPGMLEGIITAPQNIYAYASFLMAGAIGNNILCKPADIAENDKIAGIINIIEMAGGEVIKTRNGVSARMTSVMEGIEINLKDMEDMLPIVAVLCAFLKGESRIYGINGVKNKERLKELALEFNHLGIYSEVTSDGLFITGSQVIKSDGAYVWSSASFALALMIAASRAEGEVCIFGIKNIQEIEEYIEYYKQVKEK